MRVLCVGLNHRTAAVALRERLMFAPDQAATALAQLSRRWPGAEFAILSTCNRTELYAARPLHSSPRREELCQWLSGFHHVGGEELAGKVYVLADAEAGRHLLTVAAGMDSLVPGEHQIVAQVKQAHQHAVAAGTAGRVLNLLFQSALHTAKHVRQETGIARGRVSVASAAVECVRRTFASLKGRCVLSVGAGKMNSLMLREIAAMHPRRIVVANRTLKTARELAASCGGQAVKLADLPKALAEADVVITSTGSPRPLISAAMVGKALAARAKSGVGKSAAAKRTPAKSSVTKSSRKMLIVDIGVPRDVEESVGKLRGVTLRNIDDLRGVVERNLRRRKGHWTAARKIIEQHVLEVMDSLNVRDVAPTIDLLYRRMNEIAESELADARNKLAGHADAEQDWAIVERALHRAIRRILHPAAKNLRLSAGTDTARAHVAAVRRLFELD